MKNDPIYEDKSHTFVAVLLINFCVLFHIKTVLFFTPSLVWGGFLRIILMIES